MSGWLTTHGYDQLHRDAVIKYINRESGFDFNVIDHNGACGFQWAGERRRAILSLGHGRCPSWEVQMDVANKEMHEFFCGFFHARDPFYHIRVHFGAGAIERC